MQKFAYRHMKKRLVDVVTSIFYDNPESSMHCNSKKQVQMFKTQKKLRKLQQFDNKAAAFRKKIEQNHPVITLLPQVSAYK